jgi:dienelactone hydrolase
MPDKTWFILAGALALIFLSLTPASAKIVTQTLDYAQDGTKLRGFLAYDDAVTGKRPGVLVVHEWWGLNDFARERALKLAGLGYVALAADMYGGGAVTQNRDEAGKLAGALLRNPDLLRARARAALQALAADPRVDPKRLAAIGFCFGGTTVLELAFSGADLAGVASFHGGLPKARPEDLKRIKAAVLVLHGADDPHVSAADITAFEQAMRQAGTDWQLVLFGGAVHSFTNPAAGVAYNPRAARRSWRYLQDFFQEIWRVKGRG